MDIDNILLDLEIIKKIGPDDKLAVQILPGTIKLYVHKYSLFSGAYRKLYGYNRDNTIDYLEKLSNNILKIITQINEGNLRELGKKLKISLEQANSGLDNLKNTYTDDSNVSSKLILIYNEFNEYINLLQENFKNNE